MTETVARFRKKYSLAVMLFFAGTGLAFYTAATLTQYSFFAGTLLAIFGAADLVDKGKVGL